MVMQSGEHAPASSGTSGGGEAGRPRGTVGTVVEVRILSGARSGEQMYFFDAQKVRIGRNLTSDVVLPDPGVSRHHVELTRAGTGYVARDVGSTAGTFVLPSGERVDGLVLEPTAGAPAATGKHAPAPAAPGSTGSIDISIGQIGHGPRCRIGVGLSVPFGRYVLTGRLGGGGMAEVFMARQTGLGGMFRQVALKLIQPEMWSLIDAGAMFLDEARIAADINHHNVVKIYDVGEQDGVLFLAMEYLRGVTVSNLAAQLGQRGERLPPELVAAIIGQACAGLHAAHQLRDMSGRLLNVVHRDVSPSNLMVLPEGLIKVIDFGVARADTRLNQAEVGLQGKPAYMSPEQVQSQPLDCRSDVFALGVVLYELCSGQPLFYRDDTVATFYAVVRGEVPPLRSVCPWASPHLEAVVHRALAKLPEQRFQSAAELGAELDQVVAEGGGRFSSIAAISRFLTERGVGLTGTPPALLTQIPKALYADSGRVQKATPRELFDHHDKSPVNPAAGAAAHSTSGAVPGPAPNSLDSPPPANAEARPTPLAGLSTSPLSRPPLSDQPPSGQPLSRPPLSGQPPSGQPLSRPPLSGPPLSGQPPSSLPLARSPLSGAPPSGQPLSRPPLSGLSPSGAPPSRPPLTGGPGSQLPGASKGRRGLASEPQRLLGLVLEGRYRLQRYLSRTPKAGQPLVKLTYQATLLTDGPAEARARAAGRLQGDQVIVAVCGRGDAVQRLESAQHARLQRLAAERQLPAVPAPLLPVLHCGQLPARDELDPDGSGATFLVTPRVGETLQSYAERAPLSLADRLELGRALCRTLAAVVQHEPGFVHGDLKPYRVGLWPPPALGALALPESVQLLLLDFSLPVVLGEAPRQLALGPGGGSAYLAPERWAGAPPSAAADLYALAAILYELLGGDLLRAAQCARHRREIPPLPAQPGLPPYVELAILAVLRAEPAQRPDAARLVELLTAAPAPPPLASAAAIEADTLAPAAAAAPPTGLLHIPLPAAGEPHALQTPTGRKVVLMAMTVPAGREHASLQLPLSAIPGLLPAPLLLIAHGESLMVELDGTPLGRGRDRPGLYHDASEPSTRCERYTLKPTAQGDFFDVGHRRLSVQRLHYCSVVYAHTPGPLGAVLPELGLCVHAQGALQRLVVLYVEKDQLTYALGIAVG